MAKPNKPRAIAALAKWKPSPVREVVRGHRLAKLFEKHLMNDVCVEFPPLPGLRELKLLRHGDAAAMAPMVASLPNLSGLRTLRLVGTPLARCPLEIGALRTLELTDNGLTSLPASLARLAKLEKVVVREPRLVWPPELARLRALAG